MTPIQRKLAEVQLSCLRLQHAVLKSRARQKYNPNHGPDGRFSSGGGAGGGNVHMAPDTGGGSGGGGSSGGATKKLPPPTKPTDKNGVVRVQQTGGMTNVADLSGKGLSNNDTRWAFSQAKTGDSIEYIDMNVQQHGGVWVMGKVQKLERTKSGNYNIHVDQVANRGRIVINSRRPAHRVTLQSPR